MAGWPWSDPAAGGLRAGCPAPWAHLHHERPVCLSGSLAYSSSEPAGLKFSPKVGRHSVMGRPVSPGASPASGPPPSCLWPLGQVGGLVWASAAVSHLPGTAASPGRAECAVATGPGDTVPVLRPYILLTWVARAHERGPPALCPGRASGACQGGAKPLCPPVPRPVLKPRGLRPEPLLTAGHLPASNREERADVPDPGRGG